MSRLPTPSARHTTLVAIDGMGGAGKTTLTRAVVARRPDMIQLVHGDDFYGPVGDRWHTWTPDQGYHGYFDHERLAREVLEPLRRGLRACYQIYDWGRNRLQPGGEVAPLGVVVVEGVSAAT